MKIKGGINGVMWKKLLNKINVWLIKMLPKYPLYLYR